MPGWALSLGGLGSDPAGAAEARRRDPRSETQPPTSDFQLRRPLPRQAPDALCPTQGAAETGGKGAWIHQSPLLLPEAVGAMPVPPGGTERLQASAAAAEGRRPLLAEDGDQPAPGLAASRREGTGRPKVRSGLSARPVCPSGEEATREQPGRLCAFGDGGAIWGQENLRGASAVKAGSMGEGFLCTPPGSVGGKDTGARNVRGGLRV